MYRSTKVLVYCLALLAASIGIAACGGAATNTTNTSNTTNRTNTTTNTTTTNSATSNSTTSNTTASNTTASTGDKIGVPECDEYIEKWEACYAKMPDAAKAAAKTSFDTMRNTWKTSAANPQAKAALATGCKAAMDAAKTAMSAYSCQW